MEPAPTLVDMSAPEERSAVCGVSPLPPKQSKTVYAEEGEAPPHTPAPALEQENSVGKQSGGTERDRAVPARPTCGRGCWAAAGAGGRVSRERPGRAARRPWHGTARGRWAEGRAARAGCLVAGPSHPLKDILAHMGATRDHGDTRSVGEMREKNSAASEGPGPRTIPMGTGREQIPVQHEGMWR